MKAVKLVKQILMALCRKQIFIKSDRINGQRGENRIKKLSKFKDSKQYIRVGKAL